MIAGQHLIGSTSASTGRSFKLDSKYWPACNRSWFERLSNVLPRHVSIVNSSMLPGPPSCSYTPADIVDCDIPGDVGSNKYRQAALPRNRGPPPICHVYPSEMLRLIVRERCRTGWLRQLRVLPSH